MNIVAVLSVMGATTPHRIIVSSVLLAGIGIYFVTDKKISMPTRIFAGCVCFLTIAYSLCRVYA